MDEVGQDGGGATWDALRRDWGRAHQAAGFEARKGVPWSGHETGKAESEEVGGVAGAGKGVARDLERLTANGCEDVGFEELGGQAGKGVELRIGKEFDVVEAVAGEDIIA